MTDNIRVGRAIRDYRNALRISQEELQDRLAIHNYQYARSTIGHWETGRALPPIHEIDFLKALAGSLEISVSNFVRRAKIYDADNPTTTEELTLLERELISAYRNEDFKKAMMLLTEQQ